jgi:ABC-type bacteriocin/lantibiotic exporter with double-glycine peptidase domain
MNAVVLPEPRETLLQLLQYLAEMLDEHPSEDLLQAACREAAGDWERMLEIALPTVGLQVRWLTGGNEVLRTEARRDYPLVTWITGPAGGWAIVRGRSTGRPEVTRLGSAAQRLGRSADEVFGHSNRRWARIVPLLPASALQPKEGASPTRRVLSLLRTERKDIAVVFILALGVGLFSLATPLAIQLLINWLAFGALLQPILTIGVALLLCLGLVATLRAIQRKAVEIVQRRIYVRLVTDLAARLSRLRVDALDSQHGPELANRYFDVITLQKSLSTMLLDGLSAALQALVGATLLAFYHPALLAFDAVAIFLVGLALLPLGYGAERTAIYESKKKYAVAAWLQEIAANPVGLRTGGARLAEETADRLVHAWLDARHDHFRVYFRQYIGLQVVVVVLPVLLLVLTGWLVLEGQLTLGQLVAAEFIVTSALAGILKFTEKLETVYDLLAGVDKIAGVLESPMERGHGVAVECEGPGRVRTDELGFGWPGGPPLLRDLTVQIPNAARVAIVGESGSGKSILADLLHGSRVPTSGTVCRDGIPVESIRPRVLHDDSLLLRVDSIFAGTIRDNLTLGRAVSDAQLWDILRELEVEAPVRRLHDALDTVLLPCGTPLSSAEVMMLLVARAVVVEPRMLLVDSLLDGLGPTQRDRALKALTAREAPWTLVLFTRSTLVAGGLPQLYELREGRLHARPRVSSI